MCLCEKSIWIDLVEVGSSHSLQAWNWDRLESGLILGLVFILNPTQSIPLEEILVRIEKSCRVTLRKEFSVEHMSKVSMLDVIQNNSIISTNIFLPNLARSVFNNTPVLLCGVRRCT